MNLKQLTPKLSLNKAFLRLKPTRMEIDPFKKYLTWLLDQVNEAESEEFHKNLVADFLKNTYYSPNHFINTKGRNDLVIHGGKEAKSAVGVIMEVKRPNNRSEMLKVNDVNVKAMHELMLYYLRERVTGKNLEIKHLVATNIYEWFIFDAAIFEQAFAQNKPLVKQFTDFEAGRLSGTNTEFFYREIAHPALANLTIEIEFTYLNLRQYEQPLRSEAKADDKALIALFKLFSPEHLLKLPFANDSNTLDRDFYNELLHIVGLTEVKEGSKKLIQRKATHEQQIGSLLENSINQLDSLRKIARLPNPEQWGESYEEQLFHVGLELVLTWVNRILFLKLLEGQLLTYYQGDKAYLFLNLTLLPNFSRVNDFFFQVLARKTNERNQKIHSFFAKVPYLNSSLFEPTELEHVTFMISNLTSDFTLPLLATTVLKDGTGKRKTGSLNTLAYLFEFLNAYDFGSEGAEEIQEGNKPLINAAVLGLIFEKINGYKDGSFFTPGFITMYMCRETIQRAVVQKFNERKGWSCQTVDELHDKIVDRQEASEIINSLRICDPAVGSGHFLVSALNELIALKSNLKLLRDYQGRLLRDYELEVVNDELVIFDVNGEIFKYNPKNKESLRVQETIFREKQAIIENGLFGVDINSNSVNICRLRLWIELLKHAYYKADGQLETLPNIDINIKVGNSLVSRFALDADLRQVLQGGEWSISKYKEAVQRYHASTDYYEKQGLERLMANIKHEFRSELDPKLKQLKKLKVDLAALQEQKLFTFAASLKEERAREHEIELLKAEIKLLNDEVAVTQQDPVYRQAFEWRFEFPEVLNDEGDFVGFDVVMGNPPYIRQESFSLMKGYLENHYEVYQGTADLYTYFIERGVQLVKKDGFFTYIMANKWLRSNYGKSLRQWLKQYRLLEITDFGDLPVFEHATTYPCILTLQHSQAAHQVMVAKINSLDFKELHTEVTANHYPVLLSMLGDNEWTLAHQAPQELLDKLQKVGIPLGQYVQGKIYRGITTGLNEMFIINQAVRDQLISQEAKNGELIKPILTGRNIKRYQPTTGPHYLLWLPKGWTPIQPTAQAAWAWLVDSYPFIAHYLKPFEEVAKKRLDKGNYWWELRACDYYAEFNKPKIMFPDIADKGSFTFDPHGGVFCANTAYLIGVTDLYLLGVLNSKLLNFVYRNLLATYRGGYLRFIYQSMNQLPICSPTNTAQHDVLVAHVQQLLHLNQGSLPVMESELKAIDAEIDQLVYALYGLTEAEIALVEAAML